MMDLNFWSIYMAAALSAAIFAVWVIYLPAIALLKEKAANNYHVKNNIGVFLNSPKLSCTVFFVMAVVLFPIIVPAILSERLRTVFVDNFIIGILSNE